MNKNFLKQNQNNSPSVRRLRSKIIMPAVINPEIVESAAIDPVTSDNFDTTNSTILDSTPTYQSIDDFLNKHDMLEHRNIFLREKISLRNLVIYLFLSILFNITVFKICEKYYLF